MEGTSLANTLEGSEHIPQIIRIIDATVLSVIAIIGVLGNTLVFVAYTLSYKIRTKTNIFVVNLATADFLTCLFLPFVSWSLLIEVERVDGWLDLLCGLAMGLIQVFAACSMVTIFSIGVNRYILITRSRHTYNKLYRIKLITLWIFFSWIYSILVITVPLMFNIGQLGFDIKIHACGTKTDHKLAHYYDLILTITLAPLPGTVTACYAGIYLYVRKHNKRILETYGLTRKTNGCHLSSELNKR
ncbi:G-protein coupled receptor moody [Holothuria leucospilota]|uniref:G-protein coupled receptor moody n=1 Tax=Holothuria leucospilota TaxID=206669 RepID=A0A9Q1BGJ9_HOLLE|nr:G-protein coupled receptor moody [Holothuria leucospilota]